MSYSETALKYTNSYRNKGSFAKYPETDALETEDEIYLNVNPDESSIDFVMQYLMKKDYKFDFAEDVENGKIFTVKFPSRELAKYEAAVISNELKYELVKPEAKNAYEYSLAVFGKFYPLSNLESFSVGHHEEDPYLPAEEEPAVYFAADSFLDVLDEPSYEYMADDDSDSDSFHLDHDTSVDGDNH